MNIIRYLQGERPGMSAGNVKEYRALLSLFSPSILIDTLVRLADVSFWQGVIDFVKMKLAGLAGVFIRAGQRSWVDSRFVENWRKAKEAGIPRGSYWFYDSREDPKKQAALWWSLLDGDTGELPHVADFEEGYGGPYGTRAHFRTFVAEFQRLSKLPNGRIVIYTAFYWWMDRVGNDEFFAQFKLWLAWYADMFIVRVPLPWNEDDLLFWQYTAHGDGTLYGVSSLNIDLNWFCCDAENFSLRFDVDVSTPTPPNGGSTMWFKVNASNGLYIRAKPIKGYTILGGLAHGDFVEVVDPLESGWASIHTIVRGTTILDKPAPVCWCSAAYLVPASSPIPTTPPPDPDPDPDPEPVEITSVVVNYTEGGVSKSKTLP